MANDDFIAFIKSSTDEIAAEYHRIQRRVKEDPGTAGDQGEENWAEVLRSWLPTHYTVVTKGRILASDGRASPQVDVLVLSPAYPPALEEKKLYLAAGVVAAFECKVTLRAKHIPSFFETCRIIRELAPRERGTPYTELKCPIIYGLLAHSHEWKSETSTPGENIYRLLMEADKTLKSPYDMPDIACVADVGMWCAFKSIMNDIRPPNALEVITSYMAMTAQTATPGDPFTPIGGFLTLFYQQLARKDPTMRPLAQYFLAAKALGSGQGGQRKWPLSILSPKFHENLGGNRFLNGDLYHDWNCIVV